MMLALGNFLTASLQRDHSMGLCRCIAVVSASQEERLAV